jgi:LemA protein
MDQPVNSVMFWVWMVALILAVGGVVVIWNLLVSLRNDILRAWANVDVILQQRHDEIGNLVAAVRDYMSYEQKLLTDVTEARNRLKAARTVREKSGLDNRLRNGMRSLMATVENYPDVKANHLVLDLMRRITELENTLADRREMYNSTVTNYNTMIAVFPVVLVSKPLGFAEESLFEAEEAARATPNVRLRN